MTLTGKIALLRHVTDDCVIESFKRGILTIDEEGMMPGNGETLTVHFVPDDEQPQEISKDSERVSLMVLAKGRSYPVIGPIGDGSKIEFDEDALVGEG